MLSFFHRTPIGVLRAFHQTWILPEETRVRKKNGKAAAAHDGF